MSTTRVANAAAAGATPAAASPPAAPAVPLAAYPSGLPSLAPALPEAGHRIALPPLVGSADAFAVAEIATRCAAARRTLAVFAADAQTAQRLVDEIAWLAPALRIAAFPDWETLPYDHFSPHQDLVSQRLATLYRLARGDCDVVVVAAATALYRLPPRAFLAARTFFITQGETLDADALRDQLALAGYTHVAQVVAPGEFSIRGGLIDLFPTGSTLPFRLDLFGDEIESIKTFDVDSQRTLYPVRDVRLLPAREIPLDDEGRTRFRTRFREVFEGDPSKTGIYRDVSNGVAPGGIEYWLPLFFEATSAFAEHLPADAVVLLHGDVVHAVETFWQDTEARYRLLRGERARPLLPPVDMFLPADVFFGLLKPHARIDLRRVADVDAGNERAPTRALPPLTVDRRAADPIAPLKAFIARTPSRVAILADSAGRRETMQQFFAEYGLKPALLDGAAALATPAEPHVALLAAPLHAGFEWPDAGLAVVTEAELYAGTVRRTRRDAARRSNVDAMVRDLSEVRIGDPVVHEQHGIGRYLGLATLDMGDGDNEYLELIYANDAKLYVPVASLHLISRYAGAPGEGVALHELGSKEWEKARRRAAQAAHDTAAELLNLYAQREARIGHAFKVDLHDYEAFAEGFAFEETPDQQAAIDAVVNDLTSAAPMDRLVCGDVGFGKTEVALRAAFVALGDGAQVALLVPTTLLAEQHFKLFSERFADWPVKIVELSRFRTGKEVKAALAGLADGSIDLVIGTHKLLQPDVRFRKLGLVIVDEEHRFGVRHKEQLKRLRAEVDVLTLTATPIPRTLAMSLEGLRDFSVIATAPQKRLAIKTFVAPQSAGVVREACLRELKRGGQIYYLHNDIDTIRSTAERLGKLLPEARIAIAHGQMAERELEHVMRDFYAQRINLLVCSTIIETGIDVPTANTIIIERADRLGLAQLHQLRGRVGRSHHQAYAYLLTPPPDALSAQAAKRLEAIQMMEDLGSGFYLAMHDLEIRGAGEVLGESQSGEMAEVGFQLYNDMLRAAVSALKAGREPNLAEPLGVTTEINLHVPALLPATYCSDVHERLVIYKRFASAESADEIDALQEELIDRFGELPEQGAALIAVHRLRLAARERGVTKIDAGPERTTVQFVKQPPFDPAVLIALMQRDGRMRFAGPDRLRIDRGAPALEDRIALVDTLLRKLR